MLFQKILISTVILLMAACTPSGESTTKGDSSATLPPTPVVAPFSSQKRLALVIGNSAYAGNSFLSNPVNDAEDFATALRGLNFDVIHRSNLNQQQMETVINQFMEKLRNNNGVGLFYFSGHGVQHQGENYLIPVGASRVLRAADQLRYKAVAAGFVLASMKSAGNETNLIILDACRNPPRFVKSWYKGDMIPPGLTLPLRTPDASLIAYAAAPGEVALSGEGQNNSPYVKSLMKWIQVPNLSIMDALTQVRQEVIDTTHQQQQPEFSAALNESFYFNPQATAEQRLDIEKAELEEERKRLAREKEAIEQEKVRWQAEQERLARQQDRVSAPVPVPLTDSGKFFRDRLQDGSQGPEMVWIPRGSFRMGDIQGEGWDWEKPVHSVSVSRFAMGRYEVTVGQFRRFVNATGYRTDAEKGDGCYTYKDGSWNKVKDANWQKLYFSQNDNHPVACVSWNDATAYAAWLSQQTGHTYRLPTEAQWEYAARAGTTTSRYWGNDPNDACRYANVHDNTSKKENNGFSWTHHKCTDGYAQTAPVGRFKPNAFDLFDMLGNVWEWTCSEFESKYAGKEQRCANGGSRFALRGGSWGNDPRGVRAAYRIRFSDDYRFDGVGFRLARSS